MSGEIIDVFATTIHPDSSYHNPVWVDKDNKAYFQVDMPNPFYEVVNDDNGDRLRIGERIAELREERGLTQRQLAAITGYNLSNIAKIEKGRYSVGFDILSKIADTLGCEIELIEKATE